MVIKLKKSRIMKPNLVKALFLPSMLVIGMSWLASCQKDNSISSPESMETIAAASASEAVQDASFNEIFNDVAGIDDATAGEDIGIYGTDGNGIFSGESAGGSLDATNQPEPRCFTVTVTPRDRGVFPKTVTIDFGTGCEVRGHLRKGKIITVYSGRMHIPGSKAITTFENFSIDSFAIEGKHTITNATEPGGNARRFTTQVEGAKITNLNSGEWCSWDAIRTMTQVEGNGTPFYPRDDVFSITGSRSIQCSNGKNWTSEITTPLVRKFTCRWMVAGVVQISMEAGEGTLDFGTGTCDNTATLTVNGVSRQISLR
jgi:hypothetical protein